jgi:Flp pilus assembly protein TadB
MMRLDPTAGSVSATTDRRKSEAMEAPGLNFWLKLAGILVVGGIALFIFLILLMSAVYAWGVFGTFMLLALGLLLAGWIFDRRNARRREEGSL